MVVAVYKSPFLPHTYTYTQMSGKRYSLLYNYYNVAVCTFARTTSMEMYGFFNTRLFIANYIG